MKILLVIILSSLAFSASVIHGSYTSTCHVYDNAISYAVKPSSKKIQGHLGCSEFTVINSGGENCKECKSGQWMCQGYVTAYCGPDKAKEEARKKKEAKEKEEAKKEEERKRKEAEEKEAEAAKKKAELKKQRLEAERERERLAEEKREAEEERKRLKAEKKKAEDEKKRLEKEKLKAEKAAKDADAEYARLMADDKRANKQRVTAAQNKMRHVERIEAQKAKKRRDARLAKLESDRQDRARKEARLERDRQARAEREAQRERERLARERAEREEQHRVKSPKYVFFDSSSGLMWQDNYSAKTTKKNWSEAKGYCQNFTWAGRRDWYLPNKNQLVELRKEKSRLKEVASAYYWSSTTVVGNEYLAWVVNFNGIRSGFGDKTNIFHIRCVRDGQ